MQQMYLDIFLCKLHQNYHFPVFPEFQCFFIVGTVGIGEIIGIEEVDLSERVLNEN